jgi:predicted phosphoribosyltransferase
MGDRISFADRRDAGRTLAKHLSGYRDRADVVVLGLPRGGVPVAFEVASALKAPLDVLIVRKLGVPGHRELAMGAIASGGVRVVNDELVRMLGIGDDDIAETTLRERAELERREQRYRRGRPALALEDRTVIVVDDGIATGSTMQAALSALRQLDPKELIVATPIASEAACESLAEFADDVVCASTPEPFRAVGQGYRRFDQTTDDEVEELLTSASR